MTQNRARNRAIRERMRRTGESFTRASRALVEEHEKTMKESWRKTDGSSGFRNPSGSIALQFSDADPEAEA